MLSYPQFIHNYPQPVDKSVYKTYLLYLRTSLKLGQKHYTHIRLTSYTTTPLAYIIQSWSQTYANVLT